MIDFSCSPSCLDEVLQSDVKSPRWAFGQLEKGVKTGCGTWSKQETEQKTTDFYAANCERAYCTHQAAGCNCFVPLDIGHRLGQTRSHFPSGLFLYDPRDDAKSDYKHRRQKNMADKRMRKTSVSPKSTVAHFIARIQGAIKRRRSQAKPDRKFRQRTMKINVHVQLKTKHMALPSGATSKRLDWDVHVQLKTKHIAPPGGATS